MFVIFHENESFDHYFGTYPGANGLFSAPLGATPANATPSFVQKYLDTSLNTVTISPFLMPQAVMTSAADRSCRSIPPTRFRSITATRAWRTASHVDPATGVAANDRYAMDQEGLTTDASGNIVTRTGMRRRPQSHSRKSRKPRRTSATSIATRSPSCGLWAKNFVLFDNFRQTIVGPSTPNAIAIIAGQSGRDAMGTSQQ